MRVVARAEDGTPVFDETRPLGPGGQSLPASISLLPKVEGPEAGFRVEVSLLERGPDGSDRIIARQSAEGAFVPSTLGQILLRFEDQCLGVLCGEGHSCVQGSCARSCATPTRDRPSAPTPFGTCPCRCSCDGDRCEEGRCLPRTPVKRVAAGHAHACAIDGSDRLWCFGANGAGQLGLGDTAAHQGPGLVSLEAGARSVAAGPSFSCVSLTNGKVWCFGEGNKGQLGAGASSASATPVALIDGNQAPLDGVSAVTAGGVDSTTDASAHACAVLENGDLWCWGQNAQGQLGLGHTSAVEPPTRVMTTLAGDAMSEVVAGGFHTCARQRIGRLWCWGQNHDWQLGFMDQLDRSSPEEVTSQTGFSGVTAVAAGTWHTCAIVSGGALFCWGEDAEWRLGVDSPGGDDLMVPTPVLQNQRFASLELGHRHSCAIDQQGSLWCFGTSSEGELGGFDAAGLTSSPPVQNREDGWESVALGTSFGCAVRAGGALYCFGQGADGQLGDRAVMSAPEPRRVCLP